MRVLGRTFLNGLVVIVPFIITVFVVVQSALWLDTTVRTGLKRIFYRRCDVEELPDMTLEVVLKLTITAVVGRGTVQSSRLLEDVGWYRSQSLLSEPPVFHPDSSDDFIKRLLQTSPLSITEHSTDTER